GGLAAWQAEGLALTDRPSVVRAPGTLLASVRRELVVDAAFVAAHVGDPSIHLVDARAADRFAGENETVDPVAGHIPGARNRPFKENFGADSRFKNADEIRRRFETIGEPHAVVHQCGSGVSAAANALAMEVAGLRGSRVYAGSWSEWIADPNRPFATGAQ
ncbi:MAG: rhodanese-like domain-containing protein, partial [Candidatus Baltobacteraceae bacterium]